MVLADWIVIAVIALAVGGAVAYLIRAKKKGRKCVGCPYSNNCSSCQCASQKKQKE